MSLFGPVTTAEIRVWQLASAALLQHLMEESRRLELPTLSWQLPSLGNLVAQARTEQEWTAWVEALHLDKVSPPFVHGTHTRLRASGTLRSKIGDRRVTVVLLADFDTEPEPGLRCETDAA
jgi:hypothetical protein